MLMHPLSLFHELVDGLAKVIHGIRIPGSHRIHHTVAHMVLQNHLARIVQGGTHRRQLHQNFGTVVALLHHPLLLFQMADGTGQTVNYCFLVFVDMSVTVGHAVGVNMQMI